MNNQEIIRTKDGHELTVRNLTLGDAKLLVEFMRESLPLSPYILTSESDFHFDLEKEKKWVEDKLNHQSEAMFLAFSDDKLIGALGIHGGRMKRESHRANLGMTVHPQWRGKGVGRILLNHALEFVKSAPNIMKLELGVIEINEPAISLYKSVGFKEEGRSKKGFLSDEGQFYDEIRMGIWVG